MTTATETHAVYATLADHSKVRVSDPAGWNAAQYEWSRLEEARRARRFPDVRYFCVRSTSDPAWSDAPVSLGHATPYEPSRGFKWIGDAAAAAWKKWQGETTLTGMTQGTGGWFYWHNGRPAAQGRDELGALARARGLVVQGVDGRWYPAVSQL